MRTAGAVMLPAAMAHAWTVLANIF